MIFGKNKGYLKRFDFHEILTLPEVYSLIILSIFSFLSIIFISKNENNLIYLFLNIVAILIILLLTVVYTGKEYSRIFKILKLVYIAPVIYLCYTQVHSYIVVINPHLYDNILISWDRAIFGGDPTKWIDQFANPVLTEFLQICYFLFFFLPIFHGIELYQRKQMDQLDQLIRTVSFGFFVSYILYFFMPAIGPRFTLHNFQNMNNELPGLFFSDYMRNFVNQGGGIQFGMGGSIHVANRDCMPSGHTMMTLINLFLVFKNKALQRWLQLIIGIGLIISTVYLRYHYVVDLFAGAFFAVLVILIEPKCRLFFKKIGFKNA